MKFQVGDRIQVIKKWDSAKVGMVGTILVIDADLYRNPYGVRFDDRFDGGHDLKRHCDYGYGHWLPSNCLELVEHDTDVSIDVSAYL